MKILLILLISSTLVQANSCNEKWFFNLKDRANFLWDQVRHRKSVKVLNEGENFPFISKSNELQNLSNKEIAKLTLSSPTVFDLLVRFDAMINNMKKYKEISFFNHYEKATKHEKIKLIRTIRPFVKNNSPTYLKVRKLTQNLMAWRLGEDHYNHFNIFAGKDWIKLFRIQPTATEMDQMLIEHALLRGINGIAENQGLYSKSRVSRIRKYFDKKENRLKVAALTALLTGITHGKSPIRLTKVHIAEELEVATQYVDDFFDGKLSIGKVYASVNNSTRRYSLFRSTMQAIITSVSVGLFIDFTVDKFEEGVLENSENIDEILTDKDELENNKLDTPEEIDIALDSLHIHQLKTWAEDNRPGVSQDSLNNDPTYIFLRDNVFKPKEEDE